ncbi:MAG TPA: 4-(cytidine 5'-diphospho)-2-C-methyl-D-erythritol kinase [Streptosporangiaceae bacterium]|nr:4-(cytidine 5'-diphospho)-2-C-methyl-D-erythritol kinase [Streptosporangiaceae bacterium]
MISAIRPAAAAVTARAPAKVNLQLAVGPARADGYHSLVTVFHAVSLFDDVTVALADKTTITVAGEDAAAVPADRSNLAWKAASALAKATGQRGASVRIEIRKRIPVAAGLAGGSADAAATLVACNELWQAGLSGRELAELAATLGSDVPFALVGGTAVGRGRGEQLTPALATGTYHWALAFGHEGLSTAQVYATCDRLRAARVAAGDHAAEPGEPELSHPLMAALRSGEPAQVGPLLTNDLQPAALSLQPALRRTLTAGREHGALGAVVSGSGPTCAFLARDAARARDLAVALTGSGACRSVARASGPAPGAVVVRDLDRDRSRQRS